MFTFPVSTIVANEEASSRCLWTLAVLPPEIREAYETGEIIQIRSAELVLSGRISCIELDVWRDLYHITMIPAPHTSGN